MRKVRIFEWQQNKEKDHMDKIFMGVGIFHQFGINYEEFETGPGNYSTAIVEMEDGTIKNVPVEMIQFVDKE